MNKEAQAIVLRGYIDELVKVATIGGGFKRGIQVTQPTKKPWFLQPPKPAKQVQEAQPAIPKVASTGQGASAWANAIAKQKSIQFGQNMYGSGVQPNTKPDLTKSVLNTAKAPGSAATSKALKGTESSKPATTGTDK